MYPERNRVTVAGVNIVKRHLKDTASQPQARQVNKGGIVSSEAPIHASNVQLVVKNDGRRRGGDPDRLRPGRGHQASSRRLGVQVDPQRTHRPGDRRGNLMTATTTERLDAGQGARCRGSSSATATRSRRRCSEEFSIANVMQIPGLTKIIVNMGVGEAARDSKLIDGAVRDLTTITGQKPVVTRARKSIAQFKLREGMPIGAHVTLRGDRMWEFADRLLTLALPRIRDFRGLSPKQFDGHGNYTFGLNEQVMFHEIDQDRIDRIRGMDITFVTTATTDDEGRALLRHLGFPFRTN